MKGDLLSMLRCSSCGSPGNWKLDERAHDEREIREGRLGCGRCGLWRPIRDGVVDLMVNPSTAVLVEAEGLERFAARMRMDGWDRARVMRLPYDDSGYWFAQACGMERLLETTPFAPGQSILDVGANTCWAASTFARLGLRTVALDISMTEIAPMSRLPFAADSFDWVFCCEVLHHNSRREMVDALREIHRVLRPGGRLLVMNEPLRWPTDLKCDHGVEVAEFSGNEHVYFFLEYLGMAWRAGFRCIQLDEPAYDLFFSSRPIHLTLQASALGSLKLAAINIARQRSLARRVHRWWRYLMGPDVSLHMICDKAAL
jgi:SAM-dependent methyltransferase/uncharacterized protein YbaR (Trm112 family)